MKELEKWQLDRLIDLCKSRVAAKGFAGVWAVCKDHIIDLKLNEPINLIEAKSVAHKLVKEDRRYIVVEIDNYDYEIKDNPDYQIDYTPGTSLSNQERQKIINECQRLLKIDRFANIKWIAHHFIKLEIEYLDDAVIIACRISEDAEYDWAFSEKDGWPYLFVNPSYELTKSIKSTNLFQKITLMITVAISIFTAIIAYGAYEKDDKPTINVLPPKHQTDTLWLGTTNRDTFLLYTK